MEEDSQVERGPTQSTESRGKVCSSSSSDSASNDNASSPATLPSVSSNNNTSATSSSSSTIVQQHNSSVISSSSFNANASIPPSMLSTSVNGINVSLTLVQQNDDNGNDASTLVQQYDTANSSMPLSSLPSTLVQQYDTANSSLPLSSLPPTFVQQYDTTNSSLPLSSLPHYESSHNSCSFDCCGSHFSDDLFLPRGGGDDGYDGQGQQQSNTFTSWDNNDGSDNESGSDSDEVDLPYKCTDPRFIDNDVEEGMAGPTDGNDKALKVAISHSLEELCHTCGVRLETDEVKIVDPMCSGDFDLWIHLHCWEVKNPQIVQLFGGINNNRILRAFSEAIAGGLLQGWQQLQCNQRYQVLSHIFYTNQSFTLTARDIITHFKCAKPGCTFCQHPNDCSYHSIQKCIHPELPLIKCRNDACDNVMHDGCVIGFQYSFGLEEQRPFVCFSCHPGDRNLFTSSTQQRDDTERQTASASTEASSNERSNDVSSSTRAVSRTRTRF